MTEPVRIGDATPLNLISLGAGIQSTTVALMAAHGEITPMPDGAIFADTGAEPTPVYKHLRWLMSPNVLPFPVHVVSAGNLTEEMRAAARGDAGGYGRAPFFVANPDGTQGMVRRQCTADYKIDPIRAKMRQLIGLRPRQRGPKHVAVRQWIGISLDEVHRVKPATESYIENRWPLIELGMRRWDCERWLERQGYPIPPRSACVYCPYRSDREWRWVKDNDPEGWATAVEIDRIMRRGPGRQQLGGDWFVHRSMKPLDEADLRNDDERGQPDLFGNECEGMCGV